MNTYRFHWLSGGHSDSTGNTPEEAINKLGGGGLANALDYYEQLPNDEHKDFRTNRVYCPVCGEKPLKKLDDGEVECPKCGYYSQKPLDRSKVNFLGGKLLDRNAYKYIRSCMGEFHRPPDHEHCMGCDGKRECLQCTPLNGFTGLLTELVRPDYSDWIPTEKGVMVGFVPEVGEAYHRRVCPKCMRHKQGEPSDVHDCKVVFYEEVDGKKQSVGQCGCYSSVHGKRGDD